VTFENEIYIADKNTILLDRNLFTALFFIHLIIACNEGISK